MILEYYNLFQLQIAFILIAVGILGPVIVYRKEILNLGNYVSKSVPATSESEKSSPNSNADITETHIGKQFTHASASEIFQDLKDLMSIRADERAKLYLGKWLRVQSNISNILDHGDHISVAFYSKGVMRCIYLDFSDDELCNRIKIMNEGEKFAAIGMIDEAKSHRISLKNCEIVNLYEHNDEF